ncbi:MAG TPA: DUF2267 domain-containing protein [Solirubrobacteraceae bacterium]|nr:DUF2267 domain-containing protein [Solirubrobacteraceae bacterium]
MGRRARVHSLPDRGHLDRTPPGSDRAPSLTTRAITGPTSCEELQSADGHEAYRALRAFLHVLRDRLPVPEAAQLAAQLPLLIRGISFEGRQPPRTPLHYRDPVECLDRVAQEAMLHGDTEASFTVAAVARVLARRVSAGEFDDIVRTLPETLRPLVSM